MAGDEDSGSESGLSLGSGYDFHDMGCERGFVVSMVRKGYWSQGEADLVNHEFKCLCAPIRDGRLKKRTMAALIYQARLRMSFVSERRKDLAAASEEFKLALGQSGAGLTDEFESGKVIEVDFLERARRPDPR